MFILRLWQGFHFRVISFRMLLSQPTCIRQIIVFSVLGVVKGWRITGCVMIKWPVKGGNKRGDKLTS